MLFVTIKSVFLQGSSWLLQTSSRFAAFLYHRGINLAFMYIALASAVFITIFLHFLFFEKILEGLLKDENLSGEDRKSRDILLILVVKLD